MTTDYQTDIIKIFFKKDIDFLFENEHSVFHRKLQSRAKGTPLELSASKPRFVPHLRVFRCYRV